MSLRSGLYRACTIGKAPPVIRVWNTTSHRTSVPGSSSSSSSPRRWNSISQRPGSDRVNFPGAVNSEFSTTLDFAKPSSKNAMPTYRILNQDGAVVDKTRPPHSITTTEALKLYNDMLTVSIMDVIMFESQRQGRISFYMVSSGEEGICCGSASILSPSDVIYMQYRGQGVFQTRGFPLSNFMNQLFGNKHDNSLGRSMPVHYGSEELNIHPISSPLATQIPHAAGSAYALKMQGLQNPEAEKRVVVCYFGEGAASEGDFHGALNIAATRGCPVIFICRNNGYAISTSTLEQYKGDGIASRGIGYGIETIRVDGNDIFAVREATKEARRLALEDGGKPVLIEAMSYRVSHHSTSDDSFAYRSKVEVEDWKRRDNPITRMRKWMEGQGIWDEEKEKKARSQIRKEVLSAFGKAEKEKKPSLRNMVEDVYAQTTEEQEEQLRELGRMVDQYPEEYNVEAFEGGRKGLEEKN